MCSRWRKVYDRALQVPVSMSELGEGLGSFARMRRNSARNSRGQRRDESRLHLRRRSQSFSAAAAARLGKDLRQGLGWGSSARSRALFKGVMTCGASQNGRSARPDRSPGGVRCGHEVGERPDQWAPPSNESGARDPLGSGRREGEGCWRSAAGLVRQWAERAPGPRGRK